MAAKDEDKGICCLLPFSLCVLILIAWKSRIILTSYILSLKTGTADSPLPSPFSYIFMLSI